MQATSTGIVLTAWERRRNRVLVVAVVVAAAVALWAVYHLALGIDLRAPASFGESGTTSAMGPGQVAFVSAIAALAAWGLLALLERLTRHAHRVWPVIAILALVASLGGPMSGTGLTSANRMELVGFHLLVGAVLIPLMYRTSPRRAASSKRGGDQFARTGERDRREAAA
ncbi:MAG TPA: DUF6069 family protein [Actinomycetota bacterium]|nr:DUF6069 family protein [Actinomycetota bacterium]